LGVTDVSASTKTTALGFVSNHLRVRRAEVCPKIDKLHLQVREPALVGRLRLSELQPDG